MSDDQKTWAMIAHLSTLGGFVFIFGNVIGPVVVMVTKGREIAEVRAAAVQAVNFQITYLIVTFSMLGLVFLGLASGYVSRLFPLAVLAFAILMLANIVLTVMAAIKSYNGEHYRYPVAFHFLH